MGTRVTPAEALNAAPDERIAAFGADAMPKVLPLDSPATILPGRK
jgi:hypothetical protein